MDEKTTTETPTSIFRIILIDWFNCGAKVTLTLRSGAQFTGRIKQRPYDYVSLQGDRIQGNEVKHDVTLAEIVAITAVAR